MVGERRVLVVVPARGGSKGVPRKNLRAVGGISLVARVGHLVAELEFVDRAVVSTDDDEIAAVAEDAGLAAPFRRPEALAGDRIGDLDVLTHALATMEQQDGVEYDVVVMLQPTSPLRRADPVEATGCEFDEKCGWDCCCWQLSRPPRPARTDLGKTSGTGVRRVAPNSMPTKGFRLP